jgi:phosphomannomutase
LLADIGATVIRLAAATFVPIDTEAVLPAFQHHPHGMYQLDAIVSTDADGGSAPLTDQTGKLVPGDILGQITRAPWGKACFTDIIKPGSTRMIV